LVEFRDQASGTMTQGNAVNYADYTKAYHGYWTNHWSRAYTGPGYSGSGYAYQEYEAGDTLTGSGTQGNYEYHGREYQTFTVNGEAGSPWGYSNSTTGVSQLGINGNVGL
jgi:hypothetical protein